MRPVRLRTWIILLILSAAIVPILLLSVVLVRQVYVGKIDQAKKRHLLIVKGLASSVDALINSHKLAIENFAAQLSELGWPTPERLQNLALQLNRTYPGFRYVQATDRFGKSIASNPEVGPDRKSDVGVDDRNREWFVNALSAKNTFISGPILGLGDQMPYVTISSPVLDTQGEVIGILCGWLDLEEIRRILRGYELSQTTHPAMIDQRGRILMHRRKEWETEMRDVSGQPFVKEMLQEQTGTFSHVIGLEGKPMLAAYATVKTVGWKVGVPQALSEVREEAFESVIRSLIWIPGLLVLLFAGAILLSRKISAPLVALAEASSASGQGRLTPVNPVPGSLPSLEVWKLQSSFNRMIDYARRRREELSSLYRVIQIMNSGLNLRDLFESCAKEIGKLVPYERMVCHLIDETGEMYRVYAVYGTLKADQLGPGMPGPIHKGSFTEWVSAHQTPLIVEDILTESRFPWGQKHYLERGMRSCAVLPVKREGKVIGTLQWASKEPGAYRLEHLDYLTVVADAFSSALVNVRLYEEQVAAAKRLSTMNRVATILASNLDIETVYTEFANEICRHIPVQRISVVLLDESRSLIETRCTMEEGTSMGFPETVRIELAKTVGMKSAIETGRPYVRTHNPTGERHSSVLDIGEFQSSIILPLVVKGESIGALGLLHREPNRYELSHLEILNPIAEQLVVAIENSRLFKRSETLLQQQRFLSHLTSQISVLNLDELLDKLTEHVRALFEVEVCFIRLVSPTGENELKAIAASNEEVKGFLSARGDSRGGIYSWIVENQRSVLVNDTSSDLRFGSRAEAKQFGLKAYLGVPIISKDRESLGMLSVFSSGKKEFSEDQLAFLEQVAREAAVAIYNAQLYSDLEVANQWKEEMVANVSHELRTPLGVIIGNADLLTEGIFGPVSERQTKALEKIKLHAGHLTLLVNNLLRFARMEKTGVSPSLSFFDPEEILEPIRSLGSYQCEKKKGLSFSCLVDNPLPLIRSDKTMLTAVLENLLGNAFKFTEKGEVEVRVRDVTEKRKLAFLVSDTGIGIAQADLPIIFDQFRQVDGSLSRHQGGFGLGLNLVKKYLHLLQGEIDVISAPGKGSTFTVRIPYEI
jgi:signal transduction histidine kinase/HAMP domain-containing protein